MIDGSDVRSAMHALILRVKALDKVRVKFIAKKAFDIAEALDAERQKRAVKPSEEGKAP